jgi:hypothetical protein
MTGVTFTDISLEISAKKASVELGQVRLNGLEIRTHPFRVGDCARKVPVTLGHRADELFFELYGLSRGKCCVDQHNCYCRN